MFSTKRISEFYHYKRVLHKDVIGYISELHGWYPAKAGRDVIMTGYLLLIKTVSFRFFFLAKMLTFAIVLLSFNLFRFIQNRLCLGYVSKHLIYQLKRKEIII